MDQIQQQLQQLNLSTKQYEYHPLCPAKLWSSNNGFCVWRLFMASTEQYPTVNNGENNIYTQSMDISSKQV